MTPVRPDQRLEEVRERVARALQRAGRPADAARIVAVSKRFPASAVEALADAGQREFGESYAQELRAKRDDLSARNLTWHFIGHLQSNKVGLLVPSEGDLPWVHSVDRASIADAMARSAPAPWPVLLQINLRDDEERFGLDAHDVLRSEVLGRALASPRLVLRGVMGMAPPVDEPEQARPYFARLRRVFERLQAHLDTVDPGAAERFSELSMGMSGDYEVAIEEGATLVRIGTALFGARDGVAP